MSTYVVRVRRSSSSEAIDYTVKEADALLAVETAEKWFRADYKRAYGSRYAGGLDLRILTIDGVVTHEAALFEVL